MRKLDLRNILSQKIVVLDGAMGTMLQPEYLKAGEIPELINLTNPDIIQSIHKKYIQAGAEIIYTNTFGANRKKLPKEYSVEEIIGAAVDIAKKATENTNCFVALDLGSIGELLEPLGTLSFEEAYDIFAEQIKVGVSKGVDLIVFETISDLYEMKAAVLAAKENSSLPILATMTFESTMRTFMGCELSSMAITLDGLGVDALGINCSLAPHELLPLVEELMKYTNLPIAVKANAGLPNADGSFAADIDLFVSSYDKFIEMGVSIIGGCCGTTPEYIKRLSKHSGKIRKHRNIALHSAVCSPSKYVDITSARIIGERLNPTGKKLMKEALINGKYDYVIQQAIEQVEAGADILDINCGLPQIDEEETMAKLVKLLQSVTDAPLQIDSSNPRAIEKALRVYNGKAIVNSVNGDDETLDAILPIVKKYGAAVIGLTLDSKGIPTSQDQRIRIAEKIVKKASEYGIPPRDVFIDPLTLTISAEPLQAKITLDTIKYISKVMGYNTVLGISNISFGLPKRDIINSSFLLCALNNGLTLPIINPNIKENMDTIRAFRVINGEDENCNDYINFYADINQNSESNENNHSIEYYILKGLKEDCAMETKLLLENNSPLDIVNNYLIPALDKVGVLYETGKLFLPQLIMCAETAKCGFNVINEILSKTNQSANKDKILLATVKGDVHDIGKNIVKVVLENYGFEIIDLGKNVEISEIISEIKEKGVKLVGLSALMTTTAENMQKTVKEIRNNNLPCKIMVGGAVINDDYAQNIGADYYAKDANDAVKIAKRVFS